MGLFYSSLCDASVCSSSPHMLEQHKDLHQMDSGKVNAFHEYLNKTVESKQNVLSWPIKIFQ